ncbi:MAG: hypothetical protein WD097_04740 [Balneolales bacterium]
MKRALDEVRADVLNVQDLPGGAYTPAMRVPNPLPEGLPLQFANTTQNRHLPGWLTLIEVTL